MNKIILTDVDESVLKFAGPFEAWLKDTKGARLAVPLIRTYCVKTALGISETETRALLKEFYATEIMDNQPPEDCAAEVLPRLYKAGYRFVAITACGTDEAFRKRRWRALEQAFGFPWEDVITVNWVEPKKPHLAKFEPTVWVEDNATHAQDGADVGHDAYLIDRAYNRVDGSFTRVTNWFEICELIGSEK